MRRFLLAQGAIVAVALLGAKMQSVVERGGYADLWWELSVGYRYPGAIAAIVLTLPLLSATVLRGVSWRALADVVAPSTGLAVAVLRVGCFLAGCCHGTLASVPWAVRFPSGTDPWQAHVSAGLLTAAAGQSLPVHPVQLYLAAAAAGAAAIAWRYRRRKSWDGQVFLVDLAVHDPLRALLEAWRAEPLAHIQVLSAAGGGAAIATLLAAWLLQRRQTRRVAAIAPAAGGA